MVEVTLRVWVTADTDEQADRIVAAILRTQLEYALPTSVVVHEQSRRVVEP